MTRERKSDRWITPGVVISGVIMGGLLLSVLAAGVAYLAARGIDPDPMLRLVADVGALVTSTGVLLLQLAGRTTVAKVERNTGLLAGAVADLPPAAAAAPVPLPAPAYVVDLDDEEDEPTQQHPLIPPLPDYSRHRRSAHR